MTADELQAWLDEREMTREQLAKHLDTTYTTVYRWATGSRAIPAFLLRALRDIDRELKTKKK